MPKKKSKKREIERKRQPATFSNPALVGLRELVKEPPQEAPPPPPVALPTPATDEDGVFRQAMAGVDPLPGRTTTLPPDPLYRPPLPVEQREELEVMSALHDLVDGDAPFSIFESDEAIQGLAEGVDPRLLHKLKRGEFSTQGHLDLHGHTREEARRALVRFISNAMAHSKRCVLIIHGRGHGSKDKIPVLKMAVKDWLIRSSIKRNVLAFCTARPCDGGAGALYVLLRKAKNTP